MNRRMIILAATLALVAPWSAPALSQAAYPSQPVIWVVPFPPGGAMDVMARALGGELAQALGQPFVIENKPGAGGNIGLSEVARAEADGHTIVIVANGMAVNPYLYTEPGYDPVEDFEPVVMVGVVPNVLVANPQYNSAETVEEVIAQAKKAPGEMSVGSAGIGTSIHLASELFQSLTGTEFLHVPYRGSGPAIPDILGGRIDYMFDSVTSAQPHIASGALRAIAVTTPQRSAALPDVPTIAEAGVPGYELIPWFGVFTPDGTPPETIAVLNEAINEALASPQVLERFAAIGAEPIGGTPEELRDHLRHEINVWGVLVPERGIRAE
ncbi:Bug family tripartite tricarboxylate transporter substrate binding protein [Aureimonas populi]|uniref:Bug family tripartite tricarboxylate transporter substrate binding protein n=1 Tax=Aureimonas populi TaxID=1701758 RepID=A0ABW5CQL7_9HYPH|nr:tripartite tricarboxylate transporter substrate binding protein [Aureimonas populi]